MSNAKTDAKTDANTELTLKHGNQTAVVSPFGASLRRYFLSRDGREWNAVWGYQGRAGKRGGQGDVLMPFPGRVRNGTYAFEGTVHELIKNDKDGPNAIHGFVRSEMWNVVHADETSAQFSYALSEQPGYPFSLQIEVSYSLGEAGLATAFKITNTGSARAPVGAGFHPYFCGIEGDMSEWKVTIPAKNYLEMDGVVPSGRVLPVETSKCDFREGRFVGRTKYNDCVCGLERDAKGFAVAHVSSRGARVSITMDKSFDYVVVYTGDQIPAPDARRAFAIEPMTCGPDAFNQKSWGLVGLAPKESLEGSYTIKAHDS